MYLSVDVSVTCAAGVSVPVASGVSVPVRRVLVYLCVGC